jgi:hypothetical protein
MKAYAVRKYFTPESREKQAPPRRAQKSRGKKAEKLSAPYDAYSPPVGYYFICRNITGRGGCVKCP